MPELLMPRIKSYEDACFSFLADLQHNNLQEGGRYVGIETLVSSRGTGGSPLIMLLSLLQVHKFSKFIHGTATLLPDMVQAVPYWVDDESLRPSINSSTPQPVQAPG